MIEIRWIKKTMMHKTDIGIYPQIVKVLQYRQRLTKTSKSGVIGLQSYEWSDWIDVPTVEEE